jgi:hypothetical protein
MEARFAGFLCGRVYTSLPRFFLTFDQGLAELRAVIAAAGQPAPPTLGGPLRRLEANALYFLGVALDADGQGGPARALLLRAAEADPESQVAARARERLQGA